MKPFATELELVEFLMRSYADEGPPTVADAVYCYGQERNNMRSVVEIATQMWKTGKARIVAIDDFSKLPEYEWQSKLLHQMLIGEGVPPKAIVGIPHPSEFPIAHMRTESIGLVRYSREHSWRTVYITSLPSNLLRAFINTITAVLREYPRLKAYSRVGAVLPWGEFAVHSQGTIKGKRFEVIGSELEKILAYYLKGDLVSAREALDYFNMRSEQKL